MGRDPSIIMSQRRNPFEELERLFDRMGREFEEMTEGWSEPWSARKAEWAEREVAVDVEDRDEEIVVTADLPGFEKGDVDLSVRENVLTIEADHEEEEEEREGEYVRRERSHRSARRSVTLPDSVVADDAAASFKNGVLTITLPKTVESRGTHVDIE